jgi:hypothetical protein
MPCENKIKDKAEKRKRVGALTQGLSLQRQLMN